MSRVATTTRFSLPSSRRALPKASRVARMDASGQGRAQSMAAWVGNKAVERVRTPSCCRSPPELRRSTPEARCLRPWDS
jgi:hypothetical protein